MRLESSCCRKPGRNLGRTSREFRRPLGPWWAAAWWDSRCGRDSPSATHAYIGAQILSPQRSAGRSQSERLTRQQHSLKYLGDRELRQPEIPGQSPKRRCARTAVPTPTEESLCGSATSRCQRRREIKAIRSQTTNCLRAEDGAETQSPRPSPPRRRRRATARRSRIQHWSGESRTGKSPRRRGTAAERTVLCRSGNLAKQMALRKLTRERSSPHNYDRA